MLRRSMSRRPVRRLATTTPLLALAALAVAGCEVNTTVDLTVEDDGSGAVTAEVTLDEEALARVPDLDDNGVSDATDLAALVRADDLGQAGWEVTAPATADGVTTVTATKPFGTPDEAVAVLEELTGADGALRDLAIERTTGFGTTSYDLAGTLDLSGGLEAFGDAGLAELLDGEPLGEDAAAIEQRLGAPLADAFTFDLSVTLPGSLDAGTGEDRGGAALWSPRLGDPAVDLAASSTERRTPVFVLAGVAVLSTVALVALLLARLVRR